jgi:exodeoxyribonuclease VII small subunit
MTKKSDPKSSALKSPDFNFEKSLTELNKLVEQLETGKLTLEQSLTAFERGIQLTRDCQQALTAAEQKVQILLEQDDKAALEPYDKDE